MVHCFGSGVLQDTIVIVSNDRKPVGHLNVPWTDKLTEGIKSDVGIFHPPLNTRGKNSTPLPPQVSRFIERIRMCRHIVVFVRDSGRGRWYWGIRSDYGELQGVSWDVYEVEDLSLLDLTLRYFKGLWSYPR